MSLPEIQDEVITFCEAAHAHALRGGLEQALHEYERALALDPQCTPALFNRGSLLLRSQRATEALECFGRLAASGAATAMVHLARGNALLALGRYAEALTDFDVAVRADPSFVLAWYNRGSALMELRRYAQALASFERVVALAPDFAASHNNRGAALLCLKRQAEAIGAFEQALRLQPGYEGALENLGNTYHDLARFDEAARCFAALTAASPERPYTLGNLLDARARCCDWGEDFPALRARIAEAVSRGQRTQVAFAFLATSDSAAAQLQCARTYAADKFPAVAEPLWRGRPYRDDRIRVAYVSADLRDHATAFLAAQLFARHDRRSFEWTAISLGPNDGSPMRSRLERAFDHFVAAGALGSPCMDYLIADRRVIPREHSAYYSEKVVQLAHCYQPNGSGREVAPVVLSRAQASLPAGGFVFCSFNGSYKITPEVFGLWMRLLRVLPGSVLWLLDDNEAATRNLRHEAAARQVEPDRWCLRRGCPRRPLGALPAGRPFPGHTAVQCSDALWCGVPVLTCLGTTFAGRAAASVLEAAGLPELVAGNLEEYEVLALGLAAQRQACPLSDCERYRRGLEAAYTLMWQRAENHLAPIPFAVPDRPMAGA